MANRFFNQFRLALDKQLCEINAVVSFGSTGAPTVVTSNYQSKGIVSVTRSSTGKYVFKFGTNASLLDTYNQLVGLHVTWDESSNSGTAPLANSYYIFSNAIGTAGTATVTVQLTNSTGTATDPASTEIGRFCFSFRNSNAP